MAGDGTLAVSFQRVLEVARRVTGGTGISAGVVLRAEMLWTGTSGESQAGVPIDGEMLFDVASVGKTFIAALVLQLAEEGRLSLDDPLRRWLPPIPHVDPSITVRQLLGHTSGVFDFVEHPRSPFRVAFGAIDFAEVSSPEQVVFDLAGEPYFRPGEGWHYSSTNYVLLRMIAVKAAGSTAADELRRRFIQPLKLSHTVVLDSAAAPPASFRVAHQWWDAQDDGRLDDVSDRPTAWMATRSPAMVYMSAADLARWSQALYDGTVLRPRSLGQMLTFRRPAPGEPYSGFGLGTGEFRIGGTPLWGHLGWGYGYTTAMFYVPDGRTSIAVLINDNNMACIHGAALGLWALTEIEQHKARSLGLAAGAILLLSPLAAYPLAAVSRRLRRRGRHTVAHSQRRIPRAARWLAMATPLFVSAATMGYVACTVKPEGPLAWNDGTGLVRAVIVLGVASLASSSAMAVFALVAWARRQASPGERIHYTLAALSAGFLVQQLAAWGLPPF